MVIAVLLLGAVVVSVAALLGAFAPTKVDVEIDRTQININLDSNANNEINNNLEIVESYFKPNINSSNINLYHDLNVVANKFTKHSHKLDATQNIYSDFQIPIVLFNK